MPGSAPMPLTPMERLWSWPLLRTLPVGVPFMRCRWPKKFWPNGKVCESSGRRQSWLTENLPVITAQLFSGSGPAPTFGFMASSRPQGLSFGCVAEEALCGFYQASGPAIGTIGFVKASVGAVRDDVGDAPTVRTYHWATGSHGFQQYQAEGFGAGGEQKSIAAGVSTG